MRNNKKILIVEDEPIVKVIKLKFERAGFLTSIARRGTEVIKKIREDKPDLVLLDLVLPEIDGFTILQDIRSDKDLKEIPVIVFSNLGDQKSIIKAQSLGVADYVIKANIDLVELISKVNEFFSRDPQ